jgi:group I intron endonuclease
MIGIYMIQCKVNNKIYIGSSLNIDSRYKQHIKILNNNSKDVNRHLKNDWIKYGSENFEFIILEECNKEVLIKKEQHYISLYKSLNRNFGYNIKEAGNAKQAQETKDILSKIKLSEEHKCKLSQINTGNKHPRCKIGLMQAKEIKQKLNNGLKIKELAYAYNCSFSTILSIKNGYHWASKEII